MDDSSSLDTTSAIAELGRIDLAENDIGQVLGRIAELAKRAIPGAAEVSVTLVSDRSNSTAAFTGELAMHLDESQYGHGRGPCLTAAESVETLLVADTANERRWPDFAADAQSRGVGSSLSVGLPVQKAVTGALNIYALEPRAFDDDAVQLAQTFAGYAAVAMANAHLYSTTAALAEQMQQAMATRAVIEQAKGVLVAQQGCTPDEAFELLVRTSQAGNRKLRDVASALVDGARRGGA